MAESIRIAQIMGKMISGGVESIVMNYYRNMDRNKVQFDFIIDMDSKYVPREEIEKLGGKIIEVPPYQHTLKYIKGLTKILRENKYEIVVSNLNTLSVISLFCAKISKVPVRIAYSHSTSNKKEYKKNIIKQILRRFSKIFPTNYFCCSEYAGRWLFGNSAYDQGKVYLVNNAIDVDKFCYNEEIRKKTRSKLGIEDKIVIGHVGRFVKQKNHSFLIDIFYEIYKKNEKTILILVGDGPIEQEIQQKVKELKIEENVKFLGIRKDVNELMQAMDIFLLPSLYEGLPVVGVEAQASGLLCILSDSMTVETKVLEETSFISLKKSAKEWANIILDKQREHQRKNTKEELINNNFDIHCEAEKLEEYFKSAKTFAKCQ